MNNMRSDKLQLKSFPMEELGRLVKEFTDSGKEVVIAAKGMSMKPLLREGKDRIILAPCDVSGLKVGDVVLYTRRDGSYVIHRIVGVNKDNSFNLMGDFQTVLEQGIKTDRIVAKACGFMRKNREFSLNAPLYKTYVKLWGERSVLRKPYIFCSNKLSALKRKLGIKKR